MWLFVLLTMVAPQEREEVWRDWIRFENTEVQAAQQSVQTMLDFALPHNRLIGLKSWKGGSVDGLAEGPGEVRASIMVGEAGGFKKFAKTIILTGVMARGIWKGKVTMVMENPSSFPEKIGTFYTDGILAFQSHEEYLAYDNAYQAELKRLQAKVGHLQNVADRLNEALKMMPKEPGLESLREEFKNLLDLSVNLTPPAIIKWVLSKGLGTAVKVGSAAGRFLVSAMATTKLL